MPPTSGSTSPLFDGGEPCLELGKISLQATKPDADRVHGVQLAVHVIYCRRSSPRSTVSLQVTAL